MSLFARRHVDHHRQPDLKIDDPTIVALLTSHFGNNSSRSLECFQALPEKKLEKRFAQESRSADLPKCYRRARTWYSAQRRC
ncbi:MAG: hypothetical protein M3069_19595 [Chloroflexota bacterium]|nr:hypothetical protein [Chloroflexota bacterium]